MIRVLLAVIPFLVVPLAPLSSAAQDVEFSGRTARTSVLEVGAVVGTFSGFSMKYQRHASLAWDFHSSFNANGFFRARIHALRENPVENSPLTFFIGPGITGGTSDSELILGPAAEAGVFFGIEHYRIVLQLMPEIEVIPRLEGRLLAGVGLRITL